MIHTFSGGAMKVSVLDCLRSGSFSMMLHLRVESFTP